LPTLLWPFWHLLCPFYCTPYWPSTTALSTPSLHLYYGPIYTFLALCEFHVQHWSIQLRLLSWMELLPLGTMDQCCAWNLPRIPVASFLYCQT
jgi:hypothetical protein